MKSHPPAAARQRGWRRKEKGIAAESRSAVLSVQLSRNWTRQAWGSNPRVSNQACLCFSGARATAKSRITQLFTVFSGRGPSSEAQKLEVWPKGFEILTCQANRLVQQDPVKRMILPSMILSFRMRPLRRLRQAGRIIEGRIIVLSGLLRCLHWLGRCRVARLFAEIREVETQSPKEAPKCQGPTLRPTVSSRGPRGVVRRACGRMPC